MKTGAILSTIIAVGATVGLGLVFVTNASPYLKIKEVSDSTNGVHVVGQIVPGTLQQDALGKKVTFKLKDDTGTMDVIYTGPPQSNLAEAPQVVVIGSRAEGTFSCDKMIVKCPSKYESKQGAAPGSKNT